MKFKKLLVLSVAYCFLAINSYAAQDIKQKMLADIAFIANTLDTVYAPAEWKKESINWDLQAELEKARNSILAKDKISLKDYQIIVKDLMKSTQDYHVNYMFFRTKSSSLPFTIKGAEGRYFIVNIDSNNPSAKKLKFKVGDEVLTINDKPVQNQVNELMQQMSASHNQTDIELAEICLTDRHSSLLINSPEGKITIKIRHKNSRKTTAHNLQWETTEEKIVDYYKYALKSKKINEFQSKEQKIKDKILKNFRIANRDMSANYEIKRLNMNKFGIGNDSSFIPSLGKVIWQSKEGPQAYIYENEEGKKIGFLRIADFFYYDFQDYKDIIRMFNTETDALIVDQNSNPGGSLINLYEIMSLFTNKPLDVPLHKMAITQQDVAEAYDLLNLINSILPENAKTQSEEDGDKIASLTLVEFLNSLRNYSKFIISEWTAGRSFTTQYPSIGIKQIKPAKNSYTKPIVLLTNSLDFSCADFMPAIIQDNKIEHIQIVGNTTAGAGGYVLTAIYPNIFGLQGFSYTGSIAERLNHMKIEGVGVTPEIKLDITANDLQNDFVDYIKYINSLVDNAIEKYNRSPSKL